MKQDLKQEAMLEIKAFKTQLYKSYRDHNENFEASVDDMIPFLKTHIDAYIQSRVQFFKPIPANELIYRCRNTDEKLEIKFSEFSAPPADKTQNLRMSREGTSYFYGAFDGNTAKNEAVDSSRKYQYFATFNTKKELILFDLAVNNIKTDENDDEVTTIAKCFLQEYARYVSLPNDNPDQYLPTQVITHFLKNCVRQHLSDGTVHNIDGIMYFSSKTHRYNVVLFYDNNTSKDILNLVSAEIVNEK